MSFGANIYDEAMIWKPFRQVWHITYGFPTQKISNANLWFFFLLSASRICLTDGHPSGKLHQKQAEYADELVL